MAATPNLVVIGASAGGVAALQRLLGSFATDWPVSVFVTIHTGNSRSFMPDILNRATRLSARFAEHKKPFSSGVYVAPPDRHLIIENTTTLLSAGPKENHARPAIDPMFRSAAEHHGSRVIGILLTGFLYDGINGLCEIGRRGGTTIVQHPLDAEVPELPKNALARLQPDYLLRLDDIPDVIARQLERKPRSIEARS